jgi:hypothetical protein
MGSKSSRNRKREKMRKKRRANPTYVTEESVGDLPRLMQLIFDASERFRRVLQSAESPELAASEVLTEACDAAERMAALAAPYDAFDVLESVRQTQMPHNPESYRETEHEGSAALIELAALVLSARGTRAGASTSHSAERRERPDEHVEEIVAECLDALNAGTMIPVFQAIATAGATSGLEVGALLRELHVRNLSYPHMVSDTLVGLFGDPDIEAECRTSFGCTVAEIVAVFDAMESGYINDWQRRLELIGDLAKLAQDEMTRAAAEGCDYEISPHSRTKGIALWDEAWQNIGDASIIDLEVVAEASSLEVDVVARVVDLFSTPMTSRTAKEAAQEFFEGRSPFRSAPLLRDPAGDTVVVQHSLLMPAIRERVEAELKSTGHWDRYARHRGDYLESASVKLLAPLLPGCTVYTSFEYFVPDPLASPPQSEPHEYTKLVEGDALLVLGDVALIIEAKAGALTSLARTGDPRRLTSDLRKIVTDAVFQCDRARERIIEDRGLRLRDGSWLGLDGVREIHSVAVSLEDLSGIATVTSNLVHAGILADEWHPWTVSLHDLRIICELVERPAELLLYLRRRTEPDVTRYFHALDELDFFLEFYASGLYVEPDPDRLASELPQFGEPSVAQKRRRKAQPLSFLTSRTDQLDAWYFHQLGVRGTPAAKPRMNANAELVDLVDALHELACPGWLRLGATMLDASGPTQRAFSQYSKDLLAMTREDGKHHSFTVLGGSRAQNAFVLIWASIAPGMPLDMATEHLRKYVTAKKHQVGAAFAAGLLFGAGDPHRPVAVTYDNRRLGDDQSLDELVQALHLQPIARSESVAQINRRRANARQRRS